MKLSRSKFIIAPNSHAAIKDEAAKLMKRAGVFGIYPTSIRTLLDAARIEQVESDELEEIRLSFLKKAPAAVSAALGTALTKIRGLADLKRRVNYVAPDTSKPRLNWVKLHELGHQEISWQRDYFLVAADDQRSLSAACEDLFDQEANAFAAEILFQGARFRKLAADYRPTFDAIFELADLHGASRQATARHFTDECDEEIAFASYFESQFMIQSDGQPKLTLGSIQASSERFREKYSNVDLPHSLEGTHPWAAARDCDKTLDGEITLAADGSSTRFLWQAWWNGYNLFVLLRKKPRLSAVGKLFS